ncbi:MULTISPECIES: DUF6229 family protein [Polymorphospora]|uniref:Uncharacterized protein n=2 Tax=Polymorphospora TaxID=338583 RepID=A0A810NDG5_9ACTN|nr:DUF6229 family protein [Polymorphospora rubra]BCJ70109.1 hypothetical protein Prubr_71300 [Polymorphospora rubra]
MSTLAPERADEIIESWLTGTAPVDGWENPAGPLFNSGRYAEYDITATGGGGGITTHTGCGPCTGSYPIECY